MMKKEYFFQKTLFSEIYLSFIGYQECESKHSFGPTLRDTYIIHLVVDGIGQFQINGHEYFLKKGDFFLIRPSDFAYYEADEKRPWVYYWLGFEGTNVDDALAELGMDESFFVGQINHLDDAINKFDAIVQNNLLKLDNDVTVQSKLLELLNLFLVNNSIERKIERQKMRYSYSFLSYVKYNYSDTNMTISQLGEIFGLNSSYFTQVIKEEIGVTPSHYIWQYRMEKSAVFLIKSDQSIREISEAVGYDNQLSFSRAFKKFYEISPSEYRKKYGSSKI